MKKLVSLLMVVIAGATITACNTVEGIGKDVKSGGSAIERAGKN